MSFFTFFSAVLLVIVIAGILNKPFSIYQNHPEEKNPMEGKRVRFTENPSEEENADGVRGHLEIIGETDYRPSFYEKYVKRSIDIVFSLLCLVILSPVFLTLCIWITIDDPGPVIFTQKRIGKNKRYFKLHKFRSMRISTPHNIPTHMLEHSDQYITKAGKFIRDHSLDELPQIWDIFIGNMSFVGPRPGLWNQDWLTAERDKWNANDVMPGLTGWAQINGRDKLDIPDKAKFDGEYVKRLSFRIDIKCFMKSFSILCGDKCALEGAINGIRKKEQG